MSAEEPQGRSGPGAAWYAAAALVVAVVAGLVWVIARGGTPDASQPPSSSTTSTSSATSGETSGVPSSSSSSPTSANAWGAGGCKGGTGSAEPPAKALASVTWTPLLASAVPESRELGPGKTDGGLRRCFEHSPAGAVVASVNIVVPAAVPESGEAVIRAQYTAGPGRDKALADLATSSGSMANMAAYRVSGCIPNRCNVQLIVFGGGSYGSALVPMVWTGEDWLVDGSVNAGEPGLVAGIPPGFTAWGPTS